MATIISLSPFRHLRAEPNQYIIFYRKGKLAKQGPGLTFFFSSLSAALAQLPVEDCETTFLLRERTADLQEVNVQITLLYRVSNPEMAAKRINFTISQKTGAWVEQPLEKLNNFWSHRAQQPARTYLTQVTIEESLATGAEKIQQAIRDDLKADPLIENEMGLSLVGIQVIRVSPSAELEKALQTPTREAIQQRADQATFERRALAVEKERAIKENELATEIELARQQENLIKQQGANQLLSFEGEARSESVRLEARLARDKIEAQAAAENQLVRAKGKADSQRLEDRAAHDAESARVELYTGAPARIPLGLALQAFARNTPAIQHLNLTPDLIAQLAKQFLQDQAK